MRLKRLELFGFKSFADRTVLEFGDDTLTGIVGPNGCGKSNVVDAMRWVLGEQRPTSMRGKEMTDVIFKGCASRPSMGMSEVTIVLDNSAGTIESHGPEISVTRRVFKSGEGEYAIDGQKGRLKDIKEMLFDTGLGSRGYSVLEQGRIDAVLSANPIDRRRIFEEAAGISRYRQRKHETELRLARVQQDLVRLDDVTGELRSRVRSLKIQAGKAERFVVARAEWEELKTRLVKHQLHRLGAELEACLVEIASIESALDEKRGERETISGAIEGLEEERGVLASNLEDISGEAARLEGDARALEERRNQLLARVQSWENAAQEEEVRAEGLTAELTARGRELEVLEEQKAALDIEVESVRGVAERQSGERNELAHGYKEYRRRVEQANELLLQKLHEKTAAQNTLVHLDRSQGPAEERFERVHRRLAEARGQLDLVRDEEKNTELEVAEKEATLARAEEALTAASMELESAVGELSVREARRGELELEIARSTSRIESLLDRERELADLGEGARAVLGAVSGEDGPCEAERLAGLLADHISTDTAHARALDAVLGERSQALVVRDPETVRSVARWLSERHEGQAALTVSGGLGATRLSEHDALPDDLEQGVLGRLRERVECEPAFASIVDSICGDVLLVRDLETALEVVARVPGSRCVTPSGEFVDVAGLVAGERTLAQGAIGRRSSAAELQAAVESMESQAAAIEAELAASRERHEAATASVAQALEAVDAGKHDLTHTRGQLRTAEVRARDLGASLELLERESAGVIEEREKLARDLVEARTRVTDVEAAFERENSALQGMELRRHELEEERDAITRAEGQSRVELTRIEEQLGGLSRRIVDLRRVREQNSGEADRARRLSSEAGESARLGQAESEELASKSAELSAQREAVSASLADVRGRAALADQELEARRRERDSATLLLEGRSGELSNLRLDEQRLALARDEISRRTEEELDLELSGLLDGFEPEEELREQMAIDGLDRQVRELKSRLEKLGPVNMEALGELEEVGGRLEFLETQIDDLNQARRGLSDTLKKIEEESERLFVKTFDEVRANFQRTFRQLFGGGKADVRLADGEPPLEAGVEISARPPGREMLPIGLLSGGQRTMTALALLFAVFEARPSPFCVLDEVDAALDDANIQRFLGMLDHFRRSTQFVVVTHNKGTMASCESLYGVTMQTKGVSRKVSVQIEEVDEIVPEARGAKASETPTSGAVSDAGDIDRESGEPIVEIVPALAHEPGEVEASA